MNDEGQIEIQKVLNNIMYGDFEIRGKMHNGQTAKVEIPYSNKIKCNFTKAAAYYVDKLKDAQMNGKDITFNITTDIKPNGDIYIIEHGYIEKSFKIKT